MKNTENFCYIETDMELDEYSYKNMFINCTAISFDEPETETEPTPKIDQVETDGFDWYLDMENAYN